MNEVLEDVWVAFSIEHKCGGDVNLHYLDHGTDYAKLRERIRYREFTTSPTQVVIHKLGEMVHSSCHDHIGREL